MSDTGISSILAPPPMTASARAMNMLDIVAVIIDGLDACFLDEVHMINRTWFTATLRPRWRDNLSVVNIMKHLAQQQRALQERPAKTLFERYHALGKPKEEDTVDLHADEVVERDCHQNKRSLTGSAPSFSSHEWLHIFARREAYAKVIETLSIFTEPTECKKQDDYRSRNLPVREEILDAFVDLAYPSLTTLDLSADHAWHTGGIGLLAAFGRNLKVLILGVPETSLATGPQDLEECPSPPSYVQLDLYRNFSYDEEPKPRPDLEIIHEACPDLEVLRTPYFHDPQHYADFLLRKTFRTLEFGQGWNNGDSEPTLKHQVWTAELAYHVATSQQLTCLRIETGDRHPEAKWFVELAMSRKVLFPNVEHLAIGGDPDELVAILPAISRSVLTLTIEVVRQGHWRNSDNDDLTGVIAALNQMPRLLGLVIRFQPVAQLLPGYLRRLGPLPSLLWLELTPHRSENPIMYVDVDNTLSWSAWLPRFPKLRFLKLSPYQLLYGNVSPQRPGLVCDVGLDFKPECGYFEVYEHAEPYYGIGERPREGMSFSNSGKPFAHNHTQGDRYVSDLVQAECEVKTIERDYRGEYEYEVRGRSTACNAFLEQATLLATLRKAYAEERKKLSR